MPFFLVILSTNLEGDVNVLFAEGGKKSYLLPRIVVRIK
jgi:hypothetical protein